MRREILSVVILQVVELDSSLMETIIKIEILQSLLLKGNRAVIDVETDTFFGYQNFKVERVFQI